jgi:hypothetical protein
MKIIIPLVFISLFVLLCFCSHAQPYNIIKAQAFFRASTAGNIFVDENGNPRNKGVTKDYLIYIETKGTTLPQWETAYIDGLPYSIRTVEVTTTPVKLGPLKGKKEAVTVNKSPGNRLWQLAFTPQQTEMVQTASTQAITLSGTFRNKSFNYRITKIQELAKRFNP